MSGIMQEASTELKPKELKNEKSTLTFNKIRQLTKTISSIYDFKRPESPNAESDEIEEPKKDNIDELQAEKHAKIFGYPPDWSNNFFLRRLMAKLQNQMMSGQSEMQTQTLIKLQMRIHLNSTFRKI